MCSDKGVPGASPGQSEKLECPIQSFQTDSQNVTKARSEFGRVSSLFRKHPSAIEPLIGRRRILLERHFVKALFENQSPKLPEILLFRLLMGFLGLARAILRIAFVRTALDLDREFILNTASALDLHAHVRIA